MADKPKLHPFEYVGAHRLFTEERFLLADEVMVSFAPSVDLLMDYKKGKMSWAQYTERYTREQREHYKTARGDFDSLLDRAEDEKIVLLCYERFEGTDTRCHRMLLHDILKKVAAKEGFEVDFIDEIERK